MSQMWDVVGGGDKGGIVAREGKDLKSTELPSRLATGSLVKELELVGDRLHYELAEGSGPKSGWVSLAFKGTPLLEKSSRRPGRVKREPGSIKSVVPCQNKQMPGPFVFYHQITFLDTKPTGMRMSGVFGAMDETRMDMHSMLDHSAESMREVVDPHVEIGCELLPAIKKLDNKYATDGMLYTHPDSRGAVQSWCRIEAEFGFPLFPFKTEEHNMFLVGKVKTADQRIHIARCKFYKAFIEDAKGALVGEEFKEDMDMFFHPLRRDHVNESLAKRPLKMLYPESTVLFTPTVFKKVKWRMSFIFADLWGLHYHGRTAEVLWDLNVLAGGPFEKLVEPEPDPQAIVINLPKKMDFGKTFDALCFLEESTSRAVYILLPTGETSPAESVLCVCARYDWDSVPEDGKVLHQQDFDVVSRVGITGLMKYVIQGEPAKVGKIFDTTKLPRP